MYVRFAGLRISDLEIALKFQTETTEKLEPIILIDQICPLLKTWDYKVIKQSDLFVEFERNTSSRYQSFSMIDEGKFELEKFEEETLLQLNFNISIWHDLLFIIPLALVGIFFNHYILFIASGFVIQSLLGIFMIKKRAIELFSHVSSLDN
jgi:hypothetical protein